MPVPSYKEWVIHAAWSELFRQITVSILNVYTYLRVYSLKIRYICPSYLSTCRVQHFCMYLLMIASVQVLLQVAMNMCVLSPVSKSLHVHAYPYYYALTAWPQ